MPKYRSRFESYCHKALGDECDFEPVTIEYSMEHKYTPDFVPKHNDHILIECKGRFRSSAEAAKYRAIRECNPSKEIIFIFMNPDCPMPHTKKRKDGTRNTHGEWATKNGFRWYTMKDIPDNWGIL